MQHQLQKQMQPHRFAIGKASGKAMSTSKSRRPRAKPDRAGEHLQADHGCADLKSTHRFRRSNPTLRMQRAFAQAVLPA
jgi:hypothetical protein